LDLRGAQQQPERRQGRSGLRAELEPDGKRIAYSSNRGGNMEIWVANADGGGAHRLTSSAASDTAPCWSPTGQEIAFTSNRSGSPQIWVMDSEGLNLRRLTNVGNYNDAPAWNPSKQWSEVAYTSRLEGGFEVAIVDLATRQVRQVTEGRGSCEYPSWAPNGRHLVFACSRGRTGSSPSRIVRAVTCKRSRPERATTCSPTGALELRHGGVAMSRTRNWPAFLPVLAAVLLLAGCGQKRPPAVATAPPAPPLSETGSAPEHSGSEPVEAGPDVPPDRERGPWRGRPLRFARARAALSRTSCSNTTRRR
jgi:hypothetical protein